MNLKQIASLWIGIIAFVMVGLYPPWILWYGIGYQPIGHGFIFDPPSSSKESKDLFGNKRIETVRANCIDIFALLIEWSIIGVISRGLIMTLATRPESKPASYSPHELETEGDKKDPTTL